MRLIETCPGQSGSFLGTGVVVGSNLVFTAKHVVECPGQKVPSSIIGRFANGREVPLTIYWTSDNHDVAILRSGEVFTEVATMDPYKTFKLGEEVCYMGGGGYEHVVLEKCGKVFQVTRSEIGTGITVFPGNSGGPVFDERNNLVGIMVKLDRSDTAGYFVPLRVFPPSKTKGTGV